MEKTIQEKAEQITKEVSEAKASAQSAEAEVATLKAELEKKAQALEEAEQSINNLDATAKEQQKSIEALRIEVKANKPADFKTAFREAFYGAKDTICKMVAEKAEKFDVKLELKSIDPIGTLTNITPNNFLGVAVDPTIVGAVPVANVFIATFGYRARTGNKLGWIEASSQNGADYVAELAQNTNISDVDFVEKSRKFAKIGHYMKISTEMENWFDALYNYCLTEGVRLIEQKIDAEIYGGAGSDSANPSKVYGIKGQATAFSALASGAVEKANIADVVMDSADQIAKEGYNANVCFLTWALYRELKELKDTTGNYIFDRVNGLLNGIRVMPTTRLSSGEVLVADSGCVEVYAGNNYELELIRDGAYDAYNVYFRKAVQVKVPTPKQKGIIYVASATTAIASLLKSE